MSDAADATPRVPTRRRRGRDGYDEAFAGLVADLRLAAPYA